MTIYAPKLIASRSIIFETKPITFEKYGFVYIWWNKSKNRYYIGSHWGLITDGYVCSSYYMLTDYKKNSDSFKRRILTIVESKQELIEAEQYWLDKIKPTELKTKYYNKSRRSSRRVA